MKPSGVEGEAVIAEQPNEDFEIKNELQKSQETKTEDLDQKYNAIIEDLKAQIEDLAKKIDEDKTTIFF
ncbi:unnamed protein product [Blepharisma stoltei]|uniref:Uncharacterized protein n=1 Tax=Blepharisma stoltei TaxID=1481888 RepID=A0AAU9JGG1_9CILI|nr:unnamed protein product [Blepharisma stoltei]